MAEDSRYYPFTTGAGATVSENDWADMAMDWAPSGVRIDTTDESTPFHMQVTQSGTATSNVAAGTAKLRGFHYRLNTDFSITHDANTANTKERIDVITLTLDMTGGTSLISIKVRKGTEAAVGTAVPPTPLRRWGASTSTTGIYDLPLATVTIRGTTTSAAIAAVTSVRQFLPGGISPVYYGSYPSPTYDGELVFDRDNRRYQAYSAPTDSWETVSDLGAFKPYTPTLIGLVQTKFATRSARYKVVGGNICHVSMFIKVNSAAVTGPFNPTLPFVAAGGYSQVMPLFWRASSTSDQKRVGIAEINSGLAYFSSLHLTGASSADLDTIVSLGAFAELRITGSYEIAV